MSKLSPSFTFVICQEIGALEEKRKEKGQHLFKFGICLVSFSLKEKVHLFGAHLNIWLFLATAVVVVTECAKTFILLDSSCDYLILIPMFHYVYGL